MTAEERRPPRAQVRERLLEAARALFTEHGYEATSLDRVAATAGFTKGAVYSNFAGKDELFLALMDQHVELRVEQVRDALQSAGDVEHTGRLAGDRLTAAFDEDSAWQLLYLDYVLRAARDPGVREHFVAHKRRVRALVNEAVRELAGAPGSGLDVDGVTSAILALQLGLGVERLTEPGSVPDDLLGTLLQALQQQFSGGGPAC